VAQGIQAGPFKVDLTKPDLNVSGPANGAEVELSAGIPTPSFASTDALSSIASKSDQLT
jgi:hypothetical protein